MTENSGAFVTTGGGGSDSGGSDSGGSDSGGSESGGSDSGGSDSGGSDSGGSSDGSGSGGSSDGSDSNSGNSSEGSANSSEGSGESSAASGDSSRESSGSTNNESTNQSSEESSRSSTENSTDSSAGSSRNNPILSATVIGLTVAGLGAVFWQAAARAMRAPPTAPPPQEVARAAQLFLRSRSHQLREDLALGAGPAVEDLAALAHIPREHLGIFGRLLRAHRKELLELADSRMLTPERSVKWLQRVGEIARTDPVLEEDGRAFLTLHEGGEPSP